MPEEDGLCPLASFDTDSMLESLRYEGSIPSNVGYTKGHDERDMMASGARYGTQLSFAVSLKQRG